MEFSTIVGLVLGIAAVFGGAVLEGISISQIIQPTAFIIVFGGTLGAIFIQFRLSDMITGMGEILPTILGVPEKPTEIRKSIVDMALKARKEGILALQGDIAALEDPFMKKGMMLMTDGTDPHLLRDLMETELGIYEDTVGTSAKFFEGFGGYTPTVGIIGAVLGLIHVMGNLDDPSKLGAGIATAFVATVYGVGLANLLFLPLGGKVKLMRKTTFHAKEMMIEGILAIQAGESPNFINEKLKVFDHGAHDDEEE